jgi:putative phage-type endonuclease
MAGAEPSEDDLLAQLEAALATERKVATRFTDNLHTCLEIGRSADLGLKVADLVEAPPLDPRRKQMYTASRFGDMAGISPYALPRSLWEVMTGRIPAEELCQGNEDTRRGQDLEPVARRAYELRFNKVCPPCDFVVHPQHIWLGATPDGLVGDSGLLEIKCPMHRAHTELPPHYMAQVQGQLEIMDRAWCDFVSWQPGRMVVIHVSRSREYWAWLYPLLERFYAHVLSGTPTPKL